MKFNKCSIPEEVRVSSSKAALKAPCRRFATNWELLSLQGMYMIRFHSFYPWHSHSNYMNLCNDKDMQMLPWVQEFKLAFLSP